MKSAVAFAITMAAMPGLVLAGDLSVPAVEAPVAAPVVVAQKSASSFGLTFRLRGGASVAPDYFGSKNYSAGPDFGFGLKAASLGKFTIGSTDPKAEKLGFGVHGSFRYIAARKTADHAELAAIAGLKDVKAAGELGFGIGYNARNFAAFTDVRYGVIGHHGFAGEMGADLVLHPSDRVKVTLGPRAQFGSAKFANTYYGSGAFNAKGGILGVGAELGATYAINDVWGIEAAATYTRLRGSAADSLVTAVGSKDQYTARLGLTRRFSIGY